MPLLVSRLSVSAFKVHTREVTQLLCTDVRRKHSNNIHSCRDFLNGPEVKTPSFQCRGCGFDPWSGN